MSPARRQAGFSLVEVLVAMFILALASAIVVMTIPRSKQGLDVEVQRFEDLLDRISARAIVSGQTLALRVEPDGYRVYARIANRWAETGMERIVLSGAVRIDVPESRGTADDPLPQIVADSVGRVYGPSVRFTTGAESRDVQPGALLREAAFD